MYIRGVEEEEEDGEMREWRVNWFLFLIGLDDLLVVLWFVSVLCEAVSLFFVKLLVLFYTVKVIGGTMTNKLCCLYVFVVISLTVIFEVKIKSELTLLT